MIVGVTRLLSVRMDVQGRAPFGHSRVPHMHTLLPSSCVCQGEARAEPDLQTISARLLAAPEAAFPPVCRAHVPLVTTLTWIESGKNRALACPSARQRERNGRVIRATPRPPVCFLTSEPPLALRRRETICLSFASISRCACAKSACSLCTWPHPEYHISDGASCMGQ